MSQFGAEKFTTRSREAIETAQLAATTAGNTQTEPGHLLAALLRDADGTARQLVAKSGADAGALAAKAEAALQALPKASGATVQQPGASPALTRVLAGALDLAASMKDDYVATEHLLISLATVESGAQKLLTDAGLTADGLREGLTAVRGNRRVTSEDAESTYESLEKYSIDLTRAAEDGRLDPVIGRDAEIRRVIQVLSRRTKKNPVLIGEPGVGKTAIVEGLSNAIAIGEVPKKLRSKHIYALDYSALVAGSRYRGDFEERLKKVLKEIRTRGDILLFLEDMRNLNGGGPGGEENESGVLGRALGRRELQIICAATSVEYDRTLRLDSTLQLVLQPISVRAPSVEHAIELLRGVRERYEAHHNVRISDSALTAAVTLADQYFKDRVLPGKAIDLIDEAGARLQIMRQTTPPPDLRELEDQIAKVRVERELAIDEDNLEKAASLRDTEKTLLNDKVRREREWKSGDADVVRDVDNEMIAEVLADLIEGQEAASPVLDGSNILSGKRLLLGVDMFQESANMWEIS